MTIRIMLADDHRMFREAILTPLAAEPDFEIVAEAGTGQQTLDSIESIQPNILVLDIALPDMSGVEVARLVLARHPDVCIVALSGYADRMFVNEMLNAGARGYVVKSAGVDELIRAIHAVISGQVFLSPEITACALGHAGLLGDKPPISVLGAREKDVLRLLASGMKSTEIAAQLGLSTSTVKSYRRNIKQKLSITSTSELTRYAIREGLQSV